MIRTWHALLVAVVVAGAVCRLGQYGSRQSYWHDEAYLVLNVIRLDFRGLLGPLEEARSPQAAPPLFLMIQRAAYLAGGSSELVMRLWPAMAGIAALALFAVLVRRSLSPAGAAAAVSLFAFSDALIWHNSEAKQYSGDVLVAVSMLLMAHRALERDTTAAGDASTNPRRFLLVSCFAALAAWLSHPACFVYGGISLALLPAMWRGGRAGGWLAGNAIATVSFASLYVLSVRVQRTAGLSIYWRERFLPLDALLQWPLWLLRQTVKIGEYAYQPLGAAVVALGVIGAVRAWQQGRTRWLAALLAPGALVLVAACLQQYPFGGHRLTLFLLPACFLLAGMALDASRHGRGVTRAAWVVALLVAAFGAGQAGYHLIRPRTRGHVRPAAEYALARYRPGDLVYTDSSELVLYWPAAAGPVRLPPLDPARIPVGSRFWVIRGYGEGGENSRMLSRARMIGVLRDQFTVRGGAAYLFNRSPVAAKRPDPAPATTRPTP